ncbi:hypothetical protein D6817_05605, partial [Candidatus Pacearchaeota archaeon]
DSSRDDYSKTTETCNGEGCSAVRRENAKYCHRCGIEYATLQRKHEQTETIEQLSKLQGNEKERNERASESELEKQAGKVSLAGVAGVVGRDIAKVAKTAARVATAPFLFTLKAAGYYLAGNLPLDAREEIGERLGDEYFAGASAVLSLVANVLFYPSAVYLTSHTLNIPENSGPVIVTGASVAILECCARTILSEENWINGKKVYEVPGSLLGTLAYLPVRVAMSAKRYISSVRERAASSSDDAGGNY